VATSAHRQPSGFQAGEAATVRFEFTNWLAPSRYTLTPTLSDAVQRAELARADDLASLVVEAPLRTGGVADLPTELEVTRR
jgi:ABC-2 type transport system ATP-binding protein/lipopolysaccharide transport system ATP-binding protein